MKTLAKLFCFLLLISTFTFVQAQCPNPIPVIVLPDTTAALNTDSVELDAGPDGLVYSWNTGAITRKIKVGQNGKYKVTVSLSGGICGTDSTQVFLLKGLTVKDTSVCPSNKLVLHIQDKFDNIQWANGQLGNTDTIKVNASTLVLCRMMFGRYYFTDTCSVQLHPLPDNTIHYPRKVFCPNDTVLELSCAPASINQWFVNDTLIGVGAKLMLKRTGAIKMKATSSHGCELTSSALQIENSLPYKARMGTLAKEKYCESDTINFSDSSALDSSFYHRLWHFDDNTFSLEKNPKHIYYQSNIYNVSLLYIDSNGCKDSVVNHVLVSGLPFADFISTHPQIDSNINTFSCYAIFSEAKNYLWSAVGGNIYEGQGTNSIKVSVPSKAIVSLQVIDHNGCVASYSNSLYAIYWGLNNPKELVQVAFYPIPCNGSFTIHHQILEDDNAMLEIYNLMGELVWQNTVISNQTIQTNLNDGVYLARLTIAGNDFHAKVIINR